MLQRIKTTLFFTIFSLISLLLISTSYSAESTIDQAVKNQKKASETKNSEQTDNFGVFKLGNIVVTGTRESDNIVINTRETIDQEDLQLNNSVTVGEALTSIPGIFSTNGTKNEFKFTLRGFDQKNVPIFYDGIPISVPNDGYVDAGSLSTGNLSQITVDKGLSSALYGPNAMGGVINLVSRRPEKNFEGDIALGVNEVDGYRSSINLGTLQKRWYMALGASIFDQRTFRLPHSFSDSRNESGKNRNNAEKKSKTGSFKIGWLPALGHEYAIGINLVDAKRDVPPHTFAESGRELKYWSFTNWDKQTTYLVGNSQLADQLKLKTRFFYDSYKNTLNSYDNADYSSQKTGRAFHSRYDDYSWGGSISLCSEQFSRQKLSLAFHYKDDVHKEQDTYGRTWERYESETYSLGLEDKIHITGYLDLVLGLSYDYQNPKYANGDAVRSSNDSFNPQIGFIWALTDQTIAHASVGRKTRFPTLLDLYASYLGSTIPNPNLEKETAINYEIGIEHEIADHTRLSFTLFYSDLEDMIVRRKLAAGNKYENIGKARYQGLEAEISTSFLPRQEIAVHYTYLDAENRTANRINNHIEELAKHKFFFSDLIKITDAISLFGKFEMFGKRWEENVADQWYELDGYALVDAKVIFNLPHQLTVEAGFRNLLDEEYEQSLGFPQPGRTAFAELRYSF